MRRYASIVYLIFASVLTSCANSPSSAEWGSVTTSLPNAAISISAPRGQLNDVTVSAVDLVNSQKQWITFFQRSWIASGFGGDKGAMELTLILFRHYAENTEQDFMKAVRLDLEREFGRTRSTIELLGQEKRIIGNREWTCYVINILRKPECALKFSGDYYLIWRRAWIANNSQTPPNEFVELADKVERSINVAF